MTHSRYVSLNFIDFDFQDPFFKKWGSHGKEPGCGTSTNLKKKKNKNTLTALYVRLLATGVWNILRDTQNPKENKLFWAHTCTQQHVSIGIEIVSLCCCESPLLHVSHSYLSKKFHVLIEFFASSSSFLENNQMLLLTCSIWPKVLLLNH